MGAVELGAGMKQGRQRFRLSLLSYPTAKPGGAVNGGQSPFILTVDWLGCLCYPFVLLLPVVFLK